MNADDMQYLRNRYVELVQRQTVLTRQWHEHSEFCEFVAGLLRERGVNTIGDLPMSDQREVAARLAKLTPESELEAEQAAVDRLEQEIAPMLPPDIFPVN
jgi:formylglycine-generating enzyme required for sulfatase activity